MTYVNCRQRWIDDRVNGDATNLCNGYSPRDPEAITSYGSYEVDGYDAATGDYCGGGMSEEPCYVGHFVIAGGRGIRHDTYCNVPPSVHVG